MTRESLNRVNVVMFYEEAKDVIMTECVRRDALIVFSEMINFVGRKA